MRKAKTQKKVEAERERGNDMMKNKKTKKINSKMKQWRKGHRAGVMLPHLKSVHALGLKAPDIETGSTCVFDFEGLIPIYYTIYPKKLFRVLYAEYSTASGCADLSPWLFLI